jgi:hypothetical protein
MSKPLPESIPEVETALAQQDVRALQTLAAAPDKQTAKAAKRALHRLRARGVVIPEVQAKPETRPGPAASRLPEAREPFLASVIDGNGDRVVLMPLKAPLGFELHVAILSEERGIVELSAQQFSRRQLRAIIAEHDSEAREVLREIPAAKAAALLAEAIQLNPESSNVPRARELLRTLSVASPPVTSSAPDPRSGAAVETDARDDRALRESAQLLESPALRGYAPTREVLEAIGQKLEEVMVSPLLVDETQRLAQMRHALERSAAEFFTPARRALLGARLRDAAEFFASRGDGENAARARAVSAALSSERPVQEIPFARGMFERIFDLDAAAKQMLPPRPEHPERSPGGLILE